MAYIKRTTKAGKIIDVENYHTSKHKPPKKKRGKNKATTPAAQIKINEKNSLRDLHYTISANFVADDLYLTNTYAKTSELPSPDEMKQNVRKFLRDLRAIYKKHGGVLKYIMITEFQKCRPHHHFLINNIGIGLKQIKKLWNFGMLKLQHFGGEPEDCERLANYFVKESNNTFNLKGEERVHGLRWIPSKNLIKPKPVKEVVHSSSWLEQPKPIKGYYIAFVIRGVTESNYPYRHYRMIKIPGSPDDDGTSQ